MLLLVAAKTDEQLSVGTSPPNPPEEGRFYTFNSVYNHVNFKTVTVLLTKWSQRKLQNAD